MTDIVLAIAIAGLMLATAYLGVHVTLHPAESDQARRKYKIGFSVCAVVACFMIGIQAYRTNSAQQVISGRLGKIEKNTSEPPKVSITNTTPPAQVIIAPPSHQEDIQKVDLPCLHPLRFSVKRGQSETAAYRKDITIEPRGAKRFRIYHSTAYINQGSVELPDGVGRLESSGPESFDIAFEEGKTPPPTLTIAFVSDTDFTFSCVDLVQKRQ